MEIKENILIVNDDPLSNQLLSLICDTYSTKLVGDVQELDQVFPEFQPDLALIVVKDGDFTGCQALKLDGMSNVPLVCLSENISLQHRFDAFGSGVEDIIQIPFDLREVSQKIEGILVNKRKRAEVDRKLSESSLLISDLQSQFVQMQAIGRFFQYSVSCHDIESLVRLFFQTISGFNIRSVVQVLTHDGNVSVFSSVGEATQLEKDVLSASDKIERVHLFGNGRGLFKWGDVRLLAHNVGDYSDMLATLLNGLEAGLQYVRREGQLIDAVNQRELANINVRKEIVALFEHMQADIEHTFASLSLLSSLSEDDKDALQDVIDRHHEIFVDLLDKNEKNDREVVELIKEYHTTSENAEAGHHSEGDESLGVELF